MLNPLDTNLYISIILVCPLNLTFADTSLSFVPKLILLVILIKTRILK
jgi:hypothetical protein